MPGLQWGVSRKHRNAQSEEWEGIDFSMGACGFRKDNENYGKSLLGHLVVWGPWFEDQWL